MRVADKIFEILKDYTDTVFFIPGGGAMYLVDALGKSGLNYVTALHEQGAGYMAIGYAMTKNSIGVCLVTSGPGSTNAITPCAAAWTDSIPVLFISGQAKLATLIGNSGLRTRGVQEIDIIPIVAPITKYCDRADGANNTLTMLDIMLKKLNSGRPGPCWLDIPVDIQGEELDV